MKSQSHTLTICVLKHSELHRLINTSPTNMETKGHKKHERHYESAHIDNCSSVKGELVLVQFCELPIYRSSSAMLKLGDDVTNNTAGKHLLKVPCERKVGLRVSFQTC